MKKLKILLKKIDKFTIKHPNIVLGAILLTPGLILAIPLPFFENLSFWLFEHVFVFIFIIFILIGFAEIPTRYEIRKNRK